MSESSNPYQTPHESLKSVPVEALTTNPSEARSPERATLIEKVTAVQGAIEAFDLSDRSFQSLWKALISLESFYKERTGEHFRRRRCGVCCAPRTSGA